MVQALAFAELLAGGILFLCGYKGYTPAEVIQGEAGAAKPLGGAEAAAKAGVVEAAPTGTIESRPAGSSGNIHTTQSGQEHSAGGGGAGFTAAPGTNYTAGVEPALVKRLSKLGAHLGVTLTGISGYRTPAHSVAVGGFADDPHTRGEASDTQGTQNIAKAILNAFGLERPFPGAAEADHIQLLHSVTTFGGY